jgi:hypothetical protein
VNVDEFKCEVVEPTLREFEARPESVRLAVLTAWSLDAWASHIYEELKPRISGLPERDGTFKKNVLSLQSDSFNFIWEYSTATKHGHAKTTQRIAASGETQSVELQGWLAFFAGVSPEEWGEYAVVNNDSFICQPVAFHAPLALIFLEGYLASNR